jgi:hypothetical protein
MRELTRACVRYLLRVDAPRTRLQDLLAPDPEPAPRVPAARAGQGRAAAASASGGASTQESAFDEDESAASFQEALRAWRNETPASKPAAQLPPQPKRETAEEIWARAQQLSAPAAKPPLAQRAAESSEPAAEISTQAGSKTMGQMSFYERLQEQKRRDGLL